LIVFSGLLWLVIGVHLLIKGLVLLVLAAYYPEQPLTLFPALRGISSSSGQIAVILVSVGLLVGFLKGRYMLAKTVRRVVGRILSLPNPVHLKKVYSFPYLAIMLSMVALGFAVKFAPLNTDVKGLVDVAIGSALINGAILYFRKAIALRATL